MLLALRKAHLMHVDDDRYVVGDVVPGHTASVAAVLCWLGIGEVLPRVPCAYARHVRHSHRDCAHRRFAMLR